MYSLETVAAPVSYWTILFILSGIFAVPLIVAVVLGLRKKNWAALYLPFVGVAALWFLAANFIDLSQVVGRAVHVPIIILLLCFLAFALFSIFKAEQPQDFGTIWWILRGWIIAAVVLLSAESFMRVFPAYDTLAINPGIKFFWHDFVNFKLNNFGHRDRDFAAKQEREYRVLLLGDSFVEGAGLNRAETFGRIAEDILNKRLGGNGRVQIYNLGHSGMNTHEEMATLDRDGTKLQPDLVILNYVFNDAETHPLEAPFVETPLWLSTIHTALSQDLGSYAYYWGYRHLTLSKKNFANYVDFYRSQHAPDGRGWQDVTRSLDRMQAWLTQNKAQGLVVIWPIFEDTWLASSRDMYRQVGEELDRHKFRVIDLTEDFAAAAPKLTTFAISQIDGHPNAAANVLAANRVADAIEQLPDFIAFKESRTISAPR